MKKRRHNISNLDVANMVADCSICGHVKIGKTGINSYRCQLAINQNKTARKHGIKVSDFGVISTPSKCCEICSATGKLYFDHDHTHHIFRGWLCRNCNLMLGYAKDNPEILRRAIDYLI